MKLNEGTWDRVIRVIVGLVLIYLGFFSQVLSGTAATVVGVIGFIPLITGLIGFCPLYTLFKFSTRKS